MQSSFGTLIFDGFIKNMEKVIEIIYKFRVYSIHFHELQIISEGGTFSQ